MLRSRPSTITVSVLLGCGVQAFAADGVDRESINVGDLSIEPMLNLTYLDDTLVLHPNAFLSLGYDDNVYQAPSGAQDDVFQTGRVGLDLIYYPGLSSIIEIEADVGYKNYTDLDERDQQLYSIDIQWAYDNEIWLHDAEARYKRSDDPAIETGRVIDREDIHADYELSYRGMLSHIDAIAFFDRIDYKEAGLYFGENDRDRNVFGIGAGMSWERAEESDIGFRVDLFSTRYDSSDSAYNDSIGLRGIFLYKVTLQDVHRFDLRLGLELRSYDDDFAGIGSNDDEQVMQPVGSLDYRWTIADDTYLTAGIDAQLVDGYDANAARVLEYSAGGSKRFPFDLEAYVIAAYTDRDASADSGSESETISVALGAAYYFRRGMALRCSLLHLTQDSNSGADFDQNVLNVDFAAVF